MSTLFCSLRRLLENKLVVKPEKFEFVASAVNLLSYVITQGQLKQAPSKIQAVAEWAVPTSRKQLQCFLGFASFYKMFIQDYSKVAAPLTHLTSTSSPFIWTSEAETAFCKLKQLFTNTPVLKHPDPSRLFVGEVDTFGSCVGAVLSQRNPDSQNHKNLSYPSAKCKASLLMLFSQL